MRIGNNIAALASSKTLSKTNDALQKSIQRLSTGLRINSASDDAAGFAISEKTRAQITGLNTAIRNSQDGISLLQTAEGALNEIQSILQRMRELSVQSANDTLTSEDRSYIQLEINELKDNIDNIANTTQFNKKRLLDGSSAGNWSSSNLNLKAHLRGGMTEIDQFGQKFSIEGNYKVEISAELGQAQVQKSNIFEITKTTTVISDEETYSISINNGVDSKGNTSGHSWYFSSDGILHITGSGRFDITGTGAATNKGIIVESSTENAVMFLKDVNINMSSTNEAAIFVQTGAAANIYLSGNNTLQGGIGRAGLEVGEGSTMVLSSAEGDFSTDGILTATGGGGQGDAGGAGIGGSVVTGQAGNILIKGGTIRATGAGQASGIGGGGLCDNALTSSGGGGTITIEGGDITARGSYGGAGIGNAGHGGRLEDYTDIIIAGGKINARGGSGITGNAGIGSACHSKGKLTIRIKEGLLASGQIQATAGGSQSQNIGGGAGYNDPQRRWAIPVVNDNDPTVPDPVKREMPDAGSTPVSHVEEKYCTLSEISQFYNSSGVFMVEKPQTITIMQGDGKTANVTLYSNDTMFDVARKINDAIANTLGQIKYVDNSSKFCTIADGTQFTSESVRAKEVINDGMYETDPNGGYVLLDPVTGKRYATFGEPIEKLGRLYGDLNAEIIRRLERIPLSYFTKATMVIRSAVSGKAGELSFSGSEEILKALGLNTIQNSSESSYTASVYDAHSGSTIARGVKVTGNKLLGVISPNVDIEFDPMPDIEAIWSEKTKTYRMTSNALSGVLHLADNGMAFQIGANRGEDLFVNIGNMSSEALGISNINVTNRKASSSAVSILDRAINIVSTQRAKIGAVQNSLEWTAENLTETSANLTAAESRIRDTDMAKEMMDFIKLQILNQSGTSMLAQSNQLPQSVLSLLQ